MRKLKNCGPVALSPNGPSATDSNHFDRSEDAICRLIGASFDVTFTTLVFIVIETLNSLWFIRIESEADQAALLRS